MTFLVLLPNVDNFAAGNGASKKSDKPQNHVLMPPELLVHIDVPIDVLKSFYLLPSLMHRMESMMLASQLRKEIAFYPSNTCISSFLVCCLSLGVMLCLILLYISAVNSS